jgi:hypothetical protein
MAEGADEHALLLQISYDLKRLQSQGAAAVGEVDKTLTAAERRAKKAAVELEESFSLKGLNFKNVEAGLAGIFNSSRAAVFGAAEEKIGSTATALEGLGAAGLVAAGGVAAVGLALETSMKSGEYALELEHLSSSLGITTTRLQQYNLLAAAGGVDSAKLDEGIAGISKTIGNLESGLIKGKQLTEFVTKLGISPEALRSWGTFDKQLPHVLDALAKLDPQERAGLAARFKVDPEVLNSLVELRDKLDGATHAGADFGVMDDATVEKAADVQKQLKLTGAVIDGQFRQAFVNLSPAILAAQGLVERFANGLNGLIYNARLSAAAISGIFGAMTGATGDPLAEARFIANGGAPAPVTRSGLNDLLHPTPKPTRIINPTGGGHKGDHGAAEAAKQSAEDLDAADKALADAQKALATSFEARAQFELTALAADEAREKTKLDADLKKAKTADERAQIGKAETEQAQAFALRRELISNQLSAQLAEQATAMANLRLAGESDLLKAQDALGGTVAQHAAVALRIFDLDEQIERSKLDEVLASKTATDAEKERARLELENLNATAPDRRQKVVNDNAVAASAAAADIREQALQAQIDQLDAEKGVFQTTEKRRQIALQLFALDEQLQESKLREQIAEAKIAGQAEKVASLQAQLGSLQATASLRGQAVSDANPKDSWAQWAQDAKTATADVGESLAKMRVDGVEAFNDSLFDSEGRLNSLSSIARNVARSFITDTEKWGVKSIEAGVFGGGQGPNGGQSANPLTAAGGMLGKLFGIKGAGGQQPTGTASDPLYVALTAGSGVADAGGLASLLGGKNGTDVGSQLGAMFGGGSSSGGGLLSSIFGGGSGGGGGLLAGLAKLIPGFAGGGSFTVGGKGGVDQNLAMMRLSAGERVTIETPQQQRDQAGGIGGGVTQHFHFPGASVDGFRRSTRQWARQSRMAMQYGS